MAKFIDLPLELLPIILQHILKTQHLATSCLISKSFYTFAVSRLYEVVSVYSWHRQWIARFLNLFTTLSDYPHLAKYVHRMEIRDYPKGFIPLDLDVHGFVLSGLRNCVNLKSCTWTRDGSLSFEVLQALQTCPNLQGLEINGRSEEYDPDALLGFTQLRRISLIMPSGPVVRILEPWMKLTGSTLRRLTLICKSSPIITDDILATLAPNLVNLEYFYMIGCIKVTNRGISSVLAANANGILALGLEALSPRFDMAEFARTCSETKALAQLQSVTLTIHQQTPLEKWTRDVIKLLSVAPLREFQIYATEAFVESRTTDEFWSEIVKTHCSRLTRFSVHRMLISASAIDNICRRCTALEELFIVIEQGSHAIELLRCLTHAKKLRSLHLNYPLEVHPNSPTIINSTIALDIIQQCSPTLRQFGFNTKVWQVDRVVRFSEDGSVTTEPLLSPYESPDIPEPFLVVRT